MRTHSARQLSPYELTHLKRHGVNPEHITEHGEMPVEYITGKVVFCDQEFDITPGALIPRIETEELVQRATSWCLSRSSNAPLRIADIGTGSGAVAVSLSLALAGAGAEHSIWGTDISAEALQIARQNAARILGSNTTVQFLESDLLLAFSADQTFDLLIANLPYIPSERIQHLDASVRNYEPWIALDGGPDGLSLIRPFLTQALEHLTPGGAVLLEVDYTHDERAFAEFQEFYTVRTDVDQFLRQRFVHLEKKP